MQERSAPRKDVTSTPAGTTRHVPAVASDASSSAENMSLLNRMSDQMRLQSKPIRGTARKPADRNGSVRGSHPRGGGAAGRGGNRMTLADRLQQPLQDRPLQDRLE